MITLLYPDYSPRRKSIWHFFVWIFVVGVALLDLYLVQRYETSYLEWEANPIAAGVYRLGGLAGVAGWRLGLLAFAWALTWARTPLARWITPVWGVVHLVLLVQLGQAWPELAGLP